MEWLELRVPKSPRWPAEGLELPVKARERGFWPQRITRGVFGLLVVAAGLTYAWTLGRVESWHIAAGSLLGGVLLLATPRAWVSQAVPRGARERYDNGVIRVGLGRWVWVGAPLRGAWPRDAVAVEHSDGWWLVCGDWRLPIEDGSALQSSL